jgi:hypothetical protein
LSLIISWHSSRFGIVCSDGLVSLRWTDGHHTVVPGKTAKKFIVLRKSPWGLVLAGSSSISQWLDFSICDVLRRFIEDFPLATFDQIAKTIGPTVCEARAAFGILTGILPTTNDLSFARKIGRSAGKLFSRAPSARPRFFYDSADGNFLNLVGFDPERRCVRSRVFACTDRCEESEVQCGATVGGFADRQQGREIAAKLLELVGRESTPKRIVDSMLSLAADVSSLHPTTIGPPYSFHLVKGVTLDRSLEEQFRRAAGDLLSS